MIYSTVFKQYQKFKYLISLFFPAKIWNTSSIVLSKGRLSEREH